MLTVRLHESCRLSETERPARRLSPKISKLLRDHRFFESSPSRPSIKRTGRPSAERVGRVAARLPVRLRETFLRLAGVKRLSDRSPRELLETVRQTRTTLPTAPARQTITGFARLDAGQLLQVARGGKPSVDFREIDKIMLAESSPVMARLVESAPSSMPPLSAMAEAAKVLWGDGRNYP